MLTEKEVAWLFPEPDNWTRDEVKSYGSLQWRDYLEQVTIDSTLNNNINEDIGQPTHSGKMMGKVAIGQGLNKWPLDKLWSVNGKWDEWVLKEAV